MDSDLMIAINIGTNKRDEVLEEFGSLLKRVTKEDRDKVIETLDAILVMNENLKLLKSAVAAVAVYKREQEKNQRLE